MIDAVLKQVLQADVKVPRYTSYPTAPHFNDSVTPDVVKGWYGALSKKAKNTSLYVHIPFCEKLCYFCGCHTKIINHYGPILSYLETLEKEMQIINKSIVDCPPVDHLHFGGGSPSALTSQDFTHTMALLRKYFPIHKDTNIAVEIDPRTVGEEKIDSYTAAGMNRISLGVQDFNPVVQKAINREQPYELVKSVLDSLLKRNIKSVNMDIIYGLPYQTIQTIHETMEQVLTLSPDRLSIFGYAHVPWMKKHQMLMPEEVMPKAEERLEMFALIKSILTQNGYISIGLDHFAKKDDSMAKAFINQTLHRNFQGYTTDTADALIGVGHSSIGFTPNGYVQNTAKPKDYVDFLDAGQLPILRGIALSDKDRIHRRIIEHIMCYMWVDLDAIRQEFSHMENTVNWDFPNALKKLKSYEDMGFVNIDGRRISLTELGTPIMRIVASAFDEYHSNSQSRHSSAA